MRISKFIALAPLATSMVAAAVIPMTSRPGALIARGTSTDTDTWVTGHETTTGSTLEVGTDVDKAKKEEAAKKEAAKKQNPVAKKKVADPADKTKGGNTTGGKTADGNAETSDDKKNDGTGKPDCPANPAATEKDAKAGDSNAAANCTGPAVVKPYTQAITELATNLPKVTSKSDIKDSLKIYKNAAKETLKAVGKFRQATVIRSKDGKGKTSKVIIKLNQLLSITTE